jgi:hypothetical protein
MLIIKKTGEGAAAQDVAAARRGFGRRLLGMTAAAALGLLAICGGAKAQPLEVYMPPNAFIHPYAGRVAVMQLPHKAGSPMLSLSHHGNGVCAIWLPKMGDPDITQALYECLAVIEVANCNGATDINTPAVKARTGMTEQVQYGRPCSGGGWNWAFNAVRTAAVVASGGPSPTSLLF